jgi:2-polyprenyl-3-methyl-5-hydroxy-6-metoxy-1,4-benzoquinol methylase
VILCPNCSKDNISIKKDKEISYCSICNHYVYNQLTEKEILFSHDHVGKHQQVTRERQFKKVFNFILNKIPNPSFLEIGAGFGGYINFAKKLGFDCTAVDIDDYYRDEYLQAGIKFIQQDANNFDINNESEIFILSHIIEHIDNPKSLLKKIGKQKVKYLIVEVPSSEGMIFKLSKLLLTVNVFFVWNRLWQKSSNSPHLHYFSDKSIYKLFKDSDFEVERTYNSRFATIRGSFKRTSSTENIIISLISVILIQFLEFLNYLTQRPENKIYIVRNLKFNS